MTIKTATGAQPKLPDVVLPIRRIPDPARQSVQRFDLLHVARHAKLNVVGDRCANSQHRKRVELIGPANPSGAVNRECEERCEKAADQCRYDDDAGE